MQEKIKLSKDRLREIHAEAKERFREIVDFEGSERKLMADDKRFGVGGDKAQWHKEDWDSRERSGRSHITIMRSNQFTDHVKNQQRQNKPAIKISPTDEGAQEKIAEYHQGIIRQVQYESKANQARQAGFDDAVDEGRGHWIVKTEFVPNTFKQKFVIEPIPDSRMVWMDWRRERPDYSDCKFGFITPHISRKDFEKKYPKADLSNWDAHENNMWFTSKDVMIAEYYCEMTKKRNLLMVEEDGETRDVYEDELKVSRESLNIIKERQIDDPYWMWFKMTGNEIVDYEMLPWKEIPIITVIGKETIVDGEWSCKGLLRDIKEPLRTYNFLCSNEADIIAKAPRAPWVGAEGQFEGHEEEYADSNNSDVPYLEYKPVTIGSQLAPPPQRAQYSVDLSNILQLKQWIIEDIKAITGIYDASIGNRSNETSGIAIQRREAQGNNANFHYIDNYAMAIAHEGRLLNDAIGVVYDMPTTVTMRNDQDEEYLQKINTDDTNTVGKGNFNVTVSVGPSFNTQREEQAAGLIEMSSNNPRIQDIGMGKVVRAQDWYGKDELADLLDADVVLRYPQLADKLTTVKQDEENELAILRQKLTESQQQMQQLTQQAQQMQEALVKADADKKAADAGKVQIELQRLELEKQRVILEGIKIKGELTLREEEIKMDAMKADLESETKLTINREKTQADLIRIAKEQPTPEIEKPEKPEKPIFNIKIDNEIKQKKPDAKISKQKDGGYKVSYEDGEKED